MTKRREKREEILTSNRMIPTLERQILIRNNQYMSLKGSADQGRGSGRKEEKPKGAEEAHQNQEAHQQQTVKEGGEKRRKETEPQKEE